MKGFPRVLWVALFVEGTRFTKAKLTGAQEFARSHGMRVPRNVLVPRTKASLTSHFSLLVNCQGMILYCSPTTRWFMQPSDVLFGMQGFVSAVQNLRGFTPAVYDITVAISKDLPAPTMLRLFKGLPSVVWSWKGCSAFSSSSSLAIGKAPLFWFWASLDRISP